MAGNLNNNNTHAHDKPQAHDTPQPLTPVANL
jgi:hypothetical protein